MGNAFTAVADDLTAVFWNPAGLAGFSLPMVYGNYHTRSISSTYDRQENVFPGYTQTLNCDFEAAMNNIDFISISVPALFWNVRWNFALSYYRYIPYNLDGSQKSDLITAGDPVETRKTEITFSGESGIDVLAFSVGVDFSEYFSVGVTLQYFFNSGRTHIQYESDDLQYQMEVIEELKGQNMIIGGLFKPDKFFSLGMVYQTGFSDTFVTETSYSENDEIETIKQTFGCDIHVPPRFALGVMIRPQESWRVSYDFSKVMWNSGTIKGLDELDTEFPFPVRDDLPIDQLDNLNHRLGMEVDITVTDVTFHIRGGIFWERQLFVDAGENKIWIKGFSLGFGIRLFSRMELDLAYLKQSATWLENGYFDPELPVENHYRNHIFALSLTYLFASTKK